MEYLARLMTLYFFIADQGNQVCQFLHIYRRKFAKMCKRSEMQEKSKARVRLN